MKHAFLSFVLFVAACRSTPVNLVGGEIRNRTREPILDVRASHQPTGRVVSVNQVLPGTSFLLGIAPRELKSRSVTLTWKTAQGRACEETLEITPPPEELRGGPCWLVYTIGGPAEASFRWELPPSSYGGTARRR